MKINIIEDVVKYINLSPKVDVKYNDEKKFRTLQTFKDKKMRQSLAKQISKKLFTEVEVEDDFIILKTANDIPIEVKDGVRGDMTQPIFVRRVVFKKKLVEGFNDIPKEEQRTAKEQADYLFGQLISQVGGEDWINEMTWQARNNDIIHNNNKGNVAYTRLRIMLKRCYNIYNQFSTQKKSKSAN